MSDIVKILRRLEATLLDEWSDDPSVVAGIAAHEIERLREALRKICDGPRDADKSYPELLAEVRIEARAALAGEKKDGS